MIEPSSRLDPAFFSFEINSKTRIFTNLLLLGKGGFAKCFEVKDEISKQHLALKINSKANPKYNKKLLEAEITIHKSLNHKNVVNCKHFLEDADNVYIFLDLCKNNTLFDLLKVRKTLTEFEVRYYIFQLTKAVQYIHSRNIIHRDLKPANLLLDSSMILKCADFGLACRINSTDKNRYSGCGTNNFMAPEIYDGSEYGAEVDIWAIGVIMYYLLFGICPFHDSDKDLIGSNVLNLKYKFPYNAEVSDSARSLIKQILILDPQLRLTLDGILKHEFISGSEIPEKMDSSTFQVAPITQPKYKTKSPVFSFNKNILSIPSPSSSSALVNPDELKAIFYISKDLGFCYLFNNRNVGILFKDSTSILYDDFTGKFIYIYDNNTSATSWDFIESSPSYLSDKVEFLIKMTAYLQPYFYNIKEDEKLVGSSNIFIFQLLDYSKIMIFFLSSNAVQVSFEYDRSNLLINCNTNKAILIAAKGPILSYDLENSLETISNDDFKKKLGKILSKLKKIADAAANK